MLGVRISARRFSDCLLVACLAAFYRVHLVDHVSLGARKLWLLGPCSLRAFIVLTNCCAVMLSCLLRGLLPTAPYRATDGPDRVRRIWSLEKDATSENIMFVLRPLSPLLLARVVGIRITANNGYRLPEGGIGALSLPCPPLSSPIYRSELRNSGNLPSPYTLVWTMQATHVHLVQYFWSLALAAKGGSSAKSGDRKASPYLAESSFGSIRQESRDLAGKRLWCVQTSTLRQAP